MEFVCDKTPQSDFFRARLFIHAEMLVGDMNLRCCFTVFTSC